MLTARRAHVVSARSVADALTALGQYKFSAAVLDINLDGDDCTVPCQSLSQRHIPFVFYTGYPTAPDGWNNVPIISKPAYGAQIVACTNAVEPQAASEVSAHSHDRSSVRSTSLAEAASNH